MLFYIYSTSKIMFKYVLKIKIINTFAIQIKLNLIKFTDAWKYSSDKMYW